MSRPRELTRDELSRIAKDVYPDLPRCEGCDSLEVAFDSGGSLLCYDCSHCRACGGNLERTECLNPTCRLYLKPARKKDE